MTRFAWTNADGDGRKISGLDFETDSGSIPLLGSHAQTLIDCNQKLHELGIENTIKLPRIVVVGDQSTGKSSLIESLSTIKVPKAKGCCTQCPLFINLSGGSNAASRWMCVITIEEHYEYDENLASKNVTKRNPFGPWQRRSQPNFVKVATTFEKDELPDLIHAAQATVINPGTRFQDHLSARDQGDSVGAPQFSPNVIRLDISEGGWPNLSFVDLPGVIANTGREKDKYLVQLIRNLVKEYILADQSLNMLTLPMTNDVENSQACAIIQDLKAESRTLAVFTKADLADDDQRRQLFKKFFGSDDLGFEHGYHFVVMPDDMEQHEARLLEQDVFSQAPWSQLNRDHQARLGISALRNHLRHFLFERTAATLPRNLSSIEERLLEVENELAQLPAPPHSMELPFKLQESVNNFERHLKALFNGDRLEQGPMAKKAWIKSAHDFRDQIIEAKPTVFLLSSEEQSRLNRALEVPKRTKLGNSASDVVDVQSDGEVPMVVKAESKEAVAKRARVYRFKLQEIRSVNEQYYCAHVPGEIELRAIEQMTKDSVQYWNEILKVFMDESYMLLKEQIMSVVKTVFGCYQHVELFAVIRDYVKAYIKDIFQQERRIAEDTCRIEQTQPMTCDLETLKSYENKCLQERLPKRLEKRLMLANAEIEAAGGGRMKRKKDESELEPDPFKTEVLMSAKVKAYYELASRRFVDNIYIGIFSRMLPACSDGLVLQLKGHLGLGQGSSEKYDQIVTWMSENPAREAKRKQLKQEKTRLTEGYTYIQRILGPKSASSSPSKRRASSSPSPVPGSSTKQGGPKTPSKRSRTTTVDHAMDDLQSPVSTPLALRVGSMELGS